MLAKYQEALMMLVREILNRTQYKHSQKYLEDIDDSHFDDDEKTEWQHYLLRSNETIMKVAELNPDDVLRIMVGSYCLKYLKTSKS